MQQENMKKHAEQCKNMKNGIEKLPNNIKTKQENGNKCKNDQNIARTKKKPEMLKKQQNNEKLVEMCKKM